MRNILGAVRILGMRNRNWKHDAVLGDAVRQILKRDAALWRCSVAFQEGSMVFLRNAARHAATQTLGGQLIAY